MIFGSERIKVTVWAEQAHKLKEELDKREDEDKIIILTSCSITEYRSKYLLQSPHHSKYCANLII